MDDEKKKYKNKEKREIQDNLYAKGPSSATKTTKTKVHIKISSAKISNHFLFSRNIFLTS